MNIFHFKGIINFYKLDGKKFDILSKDFKTFECK